MGQENITFFDRPEVAMARLLHGDIKGVGRAMISPDSLTPSERRTLLQEYLPKESLDSPYGKMLSVITNPFVLLGTILALRFPVANMKNLTKVASKLGGYDRYVNPVAKFFGDMNDTFRGTPVPDLFRGVSREIMKVREKFLGGVHDTGLTKLLRGYEKIAGKPLDVQTQYRIVMKLDGWENPHHPLKKRLGLSYLVKGNKISLNPGGDWLFNKLRGDRLKTGWFTQMYNDVLEPGEAALRFNLRQKGRGGTLMSKAERSALQKMGGSGVPQDMGGIVRQSGIAYDTKGELKRIEDYWPHLVDEVPEIADRQILQIMESQNLSAQGASRKALNAARHITTAHASNRHHAMLPNMVDLKYVKGDMLHPDLKGKVAQAWGAAEQRWLAAGVTESVAYPQQYSLALIPTMERYANGLARAWAWSVHPNKYGGKITQQLAKSGSAGPSGWVKAEMLRNTYIPWALGQQTFKQGVKSTEWTAFRKWSLDKLESPMLKGVVPEDLRAKLSDMIVSSRVMRSPMAAGGGMAGWFYLGALGLNPGSSVLNLMQTILTTAPSIGMKYTMEGMQSTMKKGSKYMRLRAAGNHADEAFAKAYPEFFESGLTPSPVLEQMLHGTVEDAWRVAVKMPGGVDKVKTGMMAMFSTSEKFVRLTAFEGAHKKALADGMRGEFALNAAREIVERTQFLPGVTGTPYGFIDMNPLLRQFLTFSSKTGNFMFGPATTWGSTEKVGALGRNWGTLGRVMAYSGATYEVGKNFLDTDLSRGLMFGALPQPTDRGPWAPAPFSPPALSLAGAAAMDLAKGEWDTLPYALPVAVPGGVAASKVVGMFSEGMAKTLGREYADYENRTPDGRIPVYSSTGSLKGYFGQGQMMARAAGLSGFGRFKDESEMMKYLVKQRDQIRDYRRRYVESMLNNDSRGMAKLQAEFKQRYPEIGQISLKKSDVRAAQLRRDVSRLERVLSTMPKDSREMFSAVVGTALGSEAEGLLGVDPALLGTGSIAQRHPQRARMTTMPSVYGP